MSEITQQDDIGDRGVVRRGAEKRGEQVWDSSDT
jgi:hypothetical protein